MKIIALFLILLSISLQGAASFMACTANSCGSLKGFKKCLADPSSSYRYFVFHPQYVGRVEARERLRRFTSVHPNCYAQFCNRVCSTVPKQFQEPAEDPVVKSSWLARQADRLRQNEKWRGRESEKRWIVQDRVEQLCERKDIVGAEIRLMCSDCSSYVKRDRELISQCQTKKNKNRGGSEYGQGYDDEEGGYGEFDDEGYDLGGRNTFSVNQFQSNNRLDWGIVGSPNRRGISDYRMNKRSRFQGPSRSMRNNNWSGSEYDQGYDTEEIDYGDLDNAGYNRGRRTKFSANQFQTNNPIDWDIVTRYVAQPPMSSAKMKKLKKLDRMSDTSSQSSRSSQGSSRSGSSQFSQASSLTSENLARFTKQQDRSRGRSDQRSVASESSSDDDLSVSDGESEVLEDEGFSDTSSFYGGR